MALEGTHRVAKFLSALTQDGNARARAAMVMGELEVVSDSLFGPDSVTHAVVQARQMVVDGADSINVVLPLTVASKDTDGKGKGQGKVTDTGKPATAEEVEIARVVPIVAALAQDSVVKSSGVTISVNTVHASVVTAAVKAGAQMLSYAPAGALDPAVLDTVAVLQVPVVLVYTAPPTGSDNIVTNVARGLADRVAAAEAAGIPLSNMLLDVGLGFCEEPEHSVALIRGLPKLREELGSQREALQHLPLVLGPSRKKFLGRIIADAAAARADDSDEAAKGVAAPAPPPPPPAPPVGAEKDWASCAAAAACVAGGADVVRMHNVKAGRDAADVAAALWR